MDSTSKADPSNRLLANYRPVLQPFAHQLEALRRSAHKRAFALFMDQGTGKTKIAIDTAVLLYERNVIRGMLIIAPNDVHTQWVTEQFDAHMPARVQTRVVIWKASSARRVREATQLITHPLPDRLHVLSMNHEALATARGKKIAERFLRAHPSILIVDESHAFKSPRAARTRAMINKLAQHAPVRRILTGTPMERPFDLYAQCEILDERILGFPNYTAFRHHYGVFTKEYVTKTIKGKQRLIEYESLQSYQRMEELEARLAAYSYRVRKADCTDLPPKLYATRRGEMSEAEFALYAVLKDEGLALLRRAERGETVTVRPLEDMDVEDVATAITDKRDRMSITVKLTLLLRLAQIAGGFATDDAGRTYSLNESPSPRQRLCLDLVRGALDASEKIIIWAQFKAELAHLQTWLAGELDEYVLRIDGTVKGAARADAIEKFKDPRSSYRILVAHPRTMGTGQNLQVARTLVYYSNGFSNIQRTQSEDRAHRIGQTGTVSIYDLNTSPIDTYIRQSQREKAAVVAHVLRDTNSEQLSQLI